MSDEISRALERLASEPVPSALERTEVIVMGRLAAYPAATSQSLGRFGAVSIGAALLMGVAGGIVPGERAPRHETISPLVTTAALAPSTLLNE